MAVVSFPRNRKDWLKINGLLVFHAGCRSGYVVREVLSQIIEI
jgi:hypothetical protein